MHRWMIIPATILALAALTPSVAAEPVDCPAKPAKARKARSLAGTFFTRGEAAGRDGRFEEAIDSFLCSLRLVPHDNTVFNLAQLSKLVDDKQLVLERLERFVKENPDSASVDGVQELIGDLEKTLGVEDADVPLPPDESSRTEETPEEEADPAGQDDGDDGPGRLRIAGWSLVGAGGTGLIIGAILQGVAAGRKDDALAATTYAEFQDREDEWKGVQSGAATFFVLGSLAAATGLVMLLVDVRGESEGSGDDAEPGVEIGLAPAAGGAALQGRF